MPSGIIDHNPIRLRKEIEIENVKQIFPTSNYYHIMSPVCLKFTDMRHRFIPKTIITRRTGASHSIIHFLRIQIKLNQINITVLFPTVSHPVADSR